MSDTDLLNNLYEEDDRIQDGDDVPIIDITDNPNSSW